MANGTIVFTKRDAFVKRLEQIDKGTEANLRTQIQKLRNRTGIGSVRDAWLKR